MISKINALKISSSYKPYFGITETSQNNNDNKYNRTDMLLASLTTTAIIGLGIAMAIKHQNTKTMHKIGAMIVEKPQTFTEKMFHEIAQEWFEKSIIDEGDNIAAIPISILKNIAKEDKEYKQILKGMNMSNNGFAIAVMDKNQQMKFDNIRYIDPKCNTMLALTNAIRNDRIYFSEIG